MELHIKAPSVGCGVRGGAVGWGTALQARRSQVWFPMVSLEFFIDIILWPYYGPGVGSPSNRNEYQGYFLGCKGGQCGGLTTLPPSCADCLETWEPQPPGTLRACNGIAFLQLLIVTYQLWMFEVGVPLIILKLCMVIGFRKSVERVLRKCTLESRITFMVAMHRPLSYVLRSSWAHEMWCGDRTWTCWYLHVRYRAGTV